MNIELVREIAKHVSTVEINGEKYPALIFSHEDFEALKDSMPRGDFYDYKRAAAFTHNQEVALNVDGLFIVKAPGPVELVEELRGIKKKIG